MFVAPATKVRIEYPQYNKSFADGDTVYEISLDEAGRIVQITSSSGEPFVVEYNTGDGESLFVNGQLQKVLSQNAFDDTCKFEAREAGAFWLESAPIGQAIAPTQYEFSNGILMVSGGELQLEYCADDFGYGVLVSHRSFFDKSKQLSWYDTFPWEERITIKGGQIRSGETATDKLNFAIIREYCHELSQVLLPLVFSDNPAYFHFLGFGASSYLTEGEVLYEPQNLSSRHGLPWAPAGGNGVGEHVNIRTDIRSNLYLMFYNGYQSIEKPYLYEQNSRVKRIRISCKNTGLFCDYEISDTAEGQMIDISPLYDIWGGTADFDIEILEVLEGSKYTDLCIDAIMPLLWNASKSKLPETLVRPVATGQIGKAAEKHSKTAPSIEPNENMPVLSDYVQTYAPNPATDSPASDSKRCGTLPMVSIISVLCTFAILSWALLRKRYKSHRTSENNP